MSLLEETAQLVIELKFEMTIFIFAVLLQQLLFNPRIFGPTTPKKKRQRVIKHAPLRSIAADRHPGGVMAVPRACPQGSAALRNAVPEACAGGSDMRAPQAVTSDAITAGAAGLATYTAVIRARLRARDAAGARKALGAMKAAGFEPSTALFNEFIYACIDATAHGALDLVSEMKACGLKPDRVTWSICLKSLGWGSRAAVVESIMASVSSAEDTDEILLASACEACIRVGRADLLRRYLARQRSTLHVQVRSAPAFRSLIRAHGYIKDVRGAWDTWSEMLARHVAPTSSTIQSMVDALVLSGDIQAGYDLLSELRMNEQTRPWIDAAIYGSILKGFSRQGHFDCVWAVYEEMLAENVELATVTFNILIDACVRNSEPAHIPRLLEEMRRRGVEPNKATYRDAMQGLRGGGMAVLGDMERRGVKPSSLTLSDLVELASRSRQPRSAKELCRDIPRKYRVELDTHVCDDMVKACTPRGDSRHASDVSTDAR